MNTLEHAMDKTKGDKRAMVKSIYEHRRITGSIKEHVLHRSSVGKSAV
jgi:hypothetical protein